MKLSDLRIGDAVTVPPSPGKQRPEGFVYEFSRYGQKGSVCVYINFYGDGIYVDYDPKNLEPMNIMELSPSMRKDAIKARQREFMKEPKP